MRFPRRFAPSLGLGLSLLATTAAADLVDSTLPLSGVSRIQLSGPYHLTVTQGDEEFVTVTTDEEDLDQIEARIDGDRLILGTNRSGFGWFNFNRNEHRAKFTVQLRALESVNNRGSGKIEIGAIDSDSDFELINQGSGNIELQSFAGEDLDLTSQGSGNTRIVQARGDAMSIKTYGSGEFHVESADMEAVSVNVHGSSDVRVGNGNAQSVEVSIHGSGDVDVGNLLAQSAEVSIHGSGDVHVHSTNELKVRVYGSGDVRYSGNPADISKTIHGSGDVVPRQ